MDAAGRAKYMLDGVLVEGISAHLLRLGAQCQGLSWNKPQQSAFAFADGTIARHERWNFALNLKGNLAAMATSLVFHLALLLAAESVQPGFDDFLSLIRNESTFE
jgi:hypothetical protein